LHEQRRDDRDNELRNAEIGEGGKHADRLDEARCHGRGD